ncbi:MASE1 domain-containing protein [Horticoccus luteus]|uniref:MASE1 domain-containing protein n=1 Tax=Horticoccus luteus TaxID=2862869 RepID=A0A8F9TWP4_9BACT|nr:MASE1 domain-containing protein [Horticoccus luteus]QYM79143.1 MASE1 domain-containing protein [Horticoccus luteus]
MRRSPVLRGLVFAGASAVAVSFPLALGRFLWPQGLSAGAEFIFWPASGVNVAGLLILGWRYWPAILCGILPAWLFFDQSLAHSALGAAGNIMEALACWWILHRFGHFDGRFDRVRAVIALCGAALLAPFICSLTVPAYLVLNGTYPRAEFLQAISNWNLANGAAILVLTPFLLALRQRVWTCRERPLETLAWIGAGVGLGLFAFNAVFRFHGENYAFLVFPFVIFAATRFDPPETTVALVLVLATIYGALVVAAGALPAGDVPAIAWFTQAFLWVLAATGLSMAALTAERRQSDHRAHIEQTRSLEASLREARARLDSLRYQVNPHFLFNTLNSIRSLTLTEPSKARDLISHLASFCRRALAPATEPLIPLHEEWTALTDYLAMEKARWESRLQIETQLDPALAGVRVPPLLLQPLVENAVKYGQRTTPLGVLHLHVTAAREDSTLVILVANTGRWVQPVATPDHTSTLVGLNNVRARLAVCYSTQASLTFTEEPGWVRATLRIPFHTLSAS